MLKQNLISIIILIIAGVCLLVSWYGHLWPFNRGYQAVALEGGEFYFGKLRWLPRPTLTEVWFIRQSQTVTSPDQAPDSALINFSNLLWGPKPVLYLKKDKIIWWTDLREDSQVVQLIRQQRSAIQPEVPQQTQPSVQAPFIESPATTTEVIE